MARKDEELSVMMAKLLTLEEKLGVQSPYQDTYDSNWGVEISNPNIITVHSNVLRHSNFRLTNLEKKKFYTYYGLFFE